jgi:hypothetical protein
MFTSLFSLRVQRRHRSRHCRLSRLTTKEPGPTLDQATVMLNLVGNNQLAVPEVSDRQTVSRATMQGILDFSLEGLVPLLQVNNVDS